MTPDASFPSPLGVLVAAGVLDSSAARRAADVAGQAGESPVAVIHQLALAPDDKVTDALANGFGLPRLADVEMPDAPVALEALSVAFLRSRRVLPVRLEDDGVWLAVVDPSTSEGPDAVAFAARRPVRLCVLGCGDWSAAFARVYGDAAGVPTEEPAPASWATDAERVRDQASAAPAVRLVERLLRDALEQGASDIHIEPLADRLRVRFRIDGVLRVAAEEPAQLADPVAARIKVLAEMDVADRRRPQDGRTSLAAEGRPIDVRISTVPSTFGETVALRLLRRDPALLDLRTLGFTQDIVALLEDVLAQRRGLFLVTGPTGSGKTTTLYAMLQRLRGAPLKILSVEDPIEYFFPDITQVQVNEEAGVTFANALRAFLRQDPDVILVGEIRDRETARIAVQAALTGHLVLATLHTNDAPGSVTRLVDMGVDRYLVAATLSAVVAQRLGRRLCPDCRRARPLSFGEKALLADHGAQATTAHDPVGCPACAARGYRGRIAIGEGLRVDDRLRVAIGDPTGAAIAAALREARHRPISAEAAARAAAGDISLAEFEEFVAP